MFEVVDVSIKIPEVVAFGVTNVSVLVMVVCAVSSVVPALVSNENKQLYRYQLSLYYQFIIYPLNFYN